jgi:S-adenosylmethionine decarboxylase
MVVCRSTEKSTMNVLGTHLLLELRTCDALKINDPIFLKEMMHQTARIMGASVLKTVIQQFSPQGVSCVVLISQSHLTIHTWPELAYAAVDIFSCGNETGLWKAAEFIKETLGA